MNFPKPRFLYETVVEKPQFTLDFRCMQFFSMVSNNIEMANATTTTVIRSAVVVPVVKEDEPKVKLKKLKEMFEEQLITAEDYEIKKNQILNSM